MGQVRTALEKIVSVFNASSLSKSSALGKLIYDVAPDGKAGNFCTYSITTEGQPDYTFGATKAYEFQRIQFNVCTDSALPGSCIDYTEQLRVIFDNYRDADTGIVVMSRVGGTRPRKDPRGGYDYTTEYIVEINNN